MQNSPTPQKKSPFQLSQKQLYILLVVTVLSIVALCIFVLSLWAKYASDETGSDSARVAQFVVVAKDGTTTQEAKDLVLTTSTLEKTYPFSVSNQDPNTASVINEVKTNYDVVITFPSEFNYANSGATMTLIDDNGTPDDTTDDTTKTVSKDTKTDGVTVSSDNKTYTFSNMGTFEANAAKTDNLTLKFALTSDDAQAGKWEGISVVVKATQVD